MLRKCAHMFDATQIGVFGMLTFLELAHMFDGWKAPGWNGSIVEMSWLWSSKRRKKTEIEDSELTSQQRSRPYCMVIINDFGVTIGNRLEIVLFFWNKHHQNCANEQLQLGRNWCGTRSVSNPAGCLWVGISMKMDLLRVLVGMLPLVVFGRLFKKWMLLFIARGFFSSRHRFIIDQTHQPNVSFMSSNRYSITPFFGVLKISWLKGTTSWSGKFVATKCRLDISPNSHSYSWHSSNRRYFAKDPSTGIHPCRCKCQ